MWTLADLKLYSMNITAFTLSLADIGDLLRIILLLSAIGYTIWKCKKDKKDD
tara:strand:- start:437 stop:592 length:156 start_codon:yes stop_codon:yes gene_type:complete